MGKHLIRDFKRWFSSQLLKQKVRYLFLAIITMYLILFVLISFFSLKENMMSYTLNNNQKTMISIGNNLKNEISTINSMSQLLMTNRDIITYLQSENFPRSLSSHRATTAMYDITNSFDHITSVYLYRLNKEYVHIAKGITWVYMEVLEDEEWLREINDKNGGYVIRIDGGGAYRSKSGEPRFPSSVWSMIWTPRSPWAFWSSTCRFHCSRIPIKTWRARISSSITLTRTFSISIRDMSSRPLSSSNPHMHPIIR